MVGLLPLASGPAYFGMAFPPFLVKQLYRCDFWMRETGTDQQVAQLHERLMMMMMRITVPTSYEISLILK